MRTLLVLGLIAGCSLPAPTPIAAPAPARPAAASPDRAGAPRAEGFEVQVRADFFDGLRGDTAALDRAVQVCEDVLAREPRHAAALVWHGAAMMARSSLAFRAGDPARGAALYAQGLGEMDRAVEIAPGDVGVRIPRGAVLLAMAPYVPEPEKSQLLARGASDYEATLARQAPYFGRLTLHAREQLLYGLTDAYATLGEPAKAAAYYQRMTRDAAGSELLARAQARSAGQAVSGPTPCQQCHGRRAKR